jgi:hypothetical protein
MVIASAALVAAAAVSIGVNLHEPKADLMRDYAAARLQFARIDLYWHVVEQQTGVYDWSIYDPVYAAAQRHHVRLILILCYGNRLYTGDDTIAPATAAARVAFASYAGAAAARFPSALFEIYNEPNLAQFWRPAPHAEAYVKLVQTAVAAIREASSSTEVIALALGGPSYDAAFAREAFDAGLLASGIAAVSFHPYFAATPEDARGAARDLRRMMRARQQELPLVVSEWGTPSEGSEEAQEERLDAMLEWAVADSIGMFVIYRWQDCDGDPTSYGLHRLDGSPRPAFACVLEWTTR